MAHSVSPSQNFLEEVAIRVGRLLTQINGESGEVVLAETFQLWSLTLASLSQKEGLSLKERAATEGQWHHQIRPKSGTAFGYVRSSGMSPERCEILEVFRSPLAAAIDGSIDWIDSNVDGDPVVHLLVVPAHHLHALWVWEEPETKVISLEGPMKRQDPYPEAEFLGRLRKMPHAIGFGSSG